MGKQQPDAGWLDTAAYYFISASTSKGLALLAQITRAPVIPAFLIRENGCYCIKFGAEIAFLETGDSEQDVIENTKLYNNAIESIIREYPEQWFWVHRRWKNRCCTSVQKIDETVQGVIQNEA